MINRLRLPPGERPRPSPGGPEPLIWAGGLIDITPDIGVLASLELRVLMTRRTVAAGRGLGITRVPEPGEGVAGTSGGLFNSTVNIADLGKSPQDGFTERQGFAGPASPAGPASMSATAARSGLSLARLRFVACLRNREKARLTLWC